MTHLRFNLNGAWVEEADVSPTTTLLRYLRDTKGLPGTKEGCAEGDCGACTVAVAEAGPDGQPTWRAINACLLLLPMLQGKHVVTVEGLAAAGAPHPAQQALVKALGSQCGYCTPGVVMSMFEASHRADLDAPWKLDDQLCGNLCRCTGYRPIRDAAQAVAGTQPDDGLVAVAPSGMGLDYEAKGQRFFTPTAWEALFDALDARPGARFVMGGTDLSLEVTKRFATLPWLVSLEALPGIDALGESTDGFRIGAGVTVSEVEAFSETRLPSLHRMVRYFGARQIKHRGTVGGNLCNASPIGDLAPCLISLGASAVVRGRAGERTLPLEDFFLDYRKTALGPGEVLAAVTVPRPSGTARAAGYKVSKRRELDISAVSAGLYVDVDGAGQVTLARLAYGGMAATPKRAARAEAALVGQPWSEASVEAAAKALAEDFSPMSDHRGSRDYRALVAANLLRGFFEETRTTRTPGLPYGHTATVLPAEGALP